MNPWIVIGTLGFPELLLWETLERGWPELLYGDDHTVKNRLQMKMRKLRGNLEWDERMDCNQPKI